MSLVKKLGIGLTEKEKREREIAKKLKIIRQEEAREEKEKWSEKITPWERLMKVVKIALFVTGFVLFPAYILHFFKIPINLDNISQILSFWGFGTFITIAIWRSILKEAHWRNYRREQMSHYKSRNDYYNSRSGNIFSSSYDNSFSNYDSNRNDSFSSLTNIDGTPMVGDVDINGNPYGVTS